MICLGQALCLYLSKAYLAQSRHKYVVGGDMSAQHYDIQRDFLGLELGRDGEPSEGMDETTFGTFWP